MIAIENLIRIDRIMIGKKWVRSRTDFNTHLLELLRSIRHFQATIIEKSKPVLNQFTETMSYAQNASSGFALRTYLDPGPYLNHL